MRVKRTVRQMLFVTAAAAVVLGLSSGTASATSETALSPAGAANCEDASTVFVHQFTSSTGVYWYLGNRGDWFTTNIWMGSRFTRICV